MTEQDFGYFSAKQYFKSSQKSRNFHNSAPETCDDLSLFDASTNGAQSSPEKGHISRAFVPALTRVSEQNIIAATECLRYILYSF